VAGKKQEQAMKKPNHKKGRPAESMDNEYGNNAIAILRVKKGASLRTIYKAARQAFTAADLQKYTEIEEGIPAEAILAELDAVDRKQGRNETESPKNLQNPQIEWI
jgi:hypothetical protein